MQHTALRHPLWRISTFVVVAVFGFLLVVSAEGKIPPFEMEVDVDGTRATVTVMLDDESFDPPDLTGLISVYPSSDLDYEGRPADQRSPTEVPLARVGPGEYQGTVHLEPGRWAVVPFPKVANVSASDLDPYPSTTHFETSTGPVLGLAGGGIAVVVVALSAVALHRRPRSRPFLAATLALGLLGVAAVALPDEGDDGFECPVTIPPQPGMTAPEPYPPTYPHPGSVWYGTERLWTVLPVDAKYEPRKSVWWSTNFPGGAEEERPNIHVRWTRLSGDERVVIDNGGQGTNAHTAEEGWFMIAGADPTTDATKLHRPGCWQVTASYKDATLTYVYERP